MKPGMTLKPGLRPELRIIVADTGPLIALARLERLALLTAVFTEVHIPRAVLAEATANRGSADGEAIHAFAMQSARSGERIDSPLVRRLLRLLDDGEVQALVLAEELGCAVLMDEKRGRQVARRQGVPVVGVLGMLLQAKFDKHIDALEPMIAQLQGSGYRLSDTLVDAVLKLAGELPEQV
jgi:predicted nucleic acid-binding protein